MERNSEERTCFACKRHDCIGAKFNASRAPLVCEHRRGNPGERLQQMLDASVAVAFDYLSHISIPYTNDLRASEQGRVVPLSSVPDSYAAGVIRRALEQAFMDGHTAGAHTAELNETCSRCKRNVATLTVDGFCDRCDKIGEGKTDA